MFALRCLGTHHKLPLVVIQEHSLFALTNVRIPEHPNANSMNTLSLGAFLSISSWRFVAVCIVLSFSSTKKV